MLEKIKNICKKIPEPIVGIMHVGLSIMCWLFIVPMIVIGFIGLCLVILDYIWDYIGVLMLIVMSVMTVGLLRASYHDSQ